jgi:hypothetical protein
MVGGQFYFGMARDLFQGRGRGRPSIAMELRYVGRSQHSPVSSPLKPLTTYERKTRALSRPARRRPVCRAFVCARRGGRGAAALRRRRPR